MAQAELQATIVVQAAQANIYQMDDAGKASLLAKLDGIAFPLSEEVGKKEFEKQSNIVEKGFKTFVEVGKALQYIKDHCLYLPQFAGPEKGAGNFKDYVSKVYNSYQRAYQILQASSARLIIKEVLKIGEVDEIWQYETWFIPIASTVQRLANNGSLTAAGVKALQLVEKLNKDNSLTGAKKREALEDAFRKALGKKAAKELSAADKRAHAYESLAKSLPEAIQMEVSRYVSELDAVTDDDKKKVQKVLTDAAAKLRYVPVKTLKDEAQKRKDKKAIERNKAKADREKKKAEKAAAKNTDKTAKAAKKAAKKQTAGLTPAQKLANARKRNQQKQQVRNLPK